MADYCANCGQEVRRGLNGVLVHSETSDAQCRYIFATLLSPEARRLREWERGRAQGPNVEERYRDMCARLRECAIRHHLGLGGELLDHLIVEELDRLKALLVTKPPDLGGLVAAHSNSPKRREGHSALRWNKQTQSLEKFDPHPAASAGEPDSAGMPTAETKTKIEPKEWLEKVMGIPDQRIPYTMRMVSELIKLYVETGGKAMKCKFCDGKGIVRDMSDGLVVDCPECDNPNPKGIDNEGDWIEENAGHEFQ